MLRPDDSPNLQIFARAPAPTRSVISGPRRGQLGLSGGPSRNQENEEERGRATGRRMIRRTMGTFAANQWRSNLEE